MPDVPLIPDVPPVPFVPDVPFTPDVPDEPDEPSPPEAPSKFTIHDVYVPDPSVLVGEPKANAPVPEL